VSQAETPPQQETKTFDPLHFVAPTEFVELPSKGMGYEESHPLYQQDVIEIRFMTAKDEDILSSRTLLKKGVAVERFLDNILVNKTIKSTDLLVGDRNAILIAARVSGYGADYETQLGCPACGTKTSFTFDLNDKKVKESTLSEELNLTKTDNGNFNTKMPYSNFNIEFRLLKGSDESILTQKTTNNIKNKLDNTMLTDQYKMMIVSVEGHVDRDIINKYVDNMPTLDSRHLKTCYKFAAPDVKIVQTFTCPSCGHEEGMEVPFGADFFWPDR
jgi:transcription elongation factor Elf1